MKHELHKRFHLSSDGFFFEYRQDRYDATVIRAKLFRSGELEPIADVRVSEGYGQPEKSHHDVINHFEGRITLGHFR